MFLYKVLKRARVGHLEGCVAVQYFNLDKQKIAYIN